MLEGGVCMDGGVERGAFPVFGLSSVGVGDAYVFVPLGDDFEEEVVDVVWVFVVWRIEVYEVDGFVSRGQSIVGPFEYVFARE